MSILTRSRAGVFKCDSPIPQLGRREAMALIAGALAFAPAALAASARTKIADLANEDGIASQLAHGLSGEIVSLRGYFAPGMRAGVLFDLFEKPAVPCGMCGAFHDSGASIAIVGEAYPDGLNMLRAIDVSGKVAVDDKGKAQLIAQSIAAV